jgi:hypothetical protein
MVLDGFGSTIGLVCIIGLSMLVSSFVFCWTHHPLRLSFRLIGGFGLWLGFGLSSSDILGQGCEATIWVVWFAWQPLIPSPLMNEFLGWVFRVNSHSN